MRVLPKVVRTGRRPLPHTKRPSSQAHHPKAVLTNRLFRDYDFPPSLCKPGVTSLCDMWPKCYYPFCKWNRYVDEVAVATHATK